MSQPCGMHVLNYITQQRYCRVIRTDTGLFQAQDEPFFYGIDIEPAICSPSFKFVMECLYTHCRMVPRDAHGWQSYLFPGGWFRYLYVDNYGV